MTYNYLEYRTVVNFRKVDEFINGNIISFPAISICVSNEFETNTNKTIISSHNGGEGIKRFHIKCQYNKITKNCEISSEQYLSVLNNQTLLSDYLNVMDLKYDVINCFIRADKKYDCQEISGLITSYNMNRKCYTFNSQLSRNFNKSFKVPEEYQIEY
jgi:hypothetical protein